MLTCPVGTGLHDETQLSVSGGARAGTFVRLAVSGGAEAAESTTTPEASGVGSCAVESKRRGERMEWQTAQWAGTASSVAPIACCDSSCAGLAPMAHASSLAGWNSPQKEASTSRAMRRDPTLCRGAGITKFRLAYGR